MAPLHQALGYLNKQWLYLHFIDHLVFKHWTSVDGWEKKNVISYWQLLQVALDIFLINKIGKESVQVWGCCLASTLSIDSIIAW